MPSSIRLNHWIPAIFTTVAMDVSAAAGAVENSSAGAAMTVPASKAIALFDRFGFMVQCFSLWFGLEQIA
jgi:hypothetical protein